MATAWERMTGQTGRAGTWSQPGLTQIAVGPGDRPIKVKGKRRALTDAERLDRLVEQQHRDMRGLRR